MAFIKILKHASISLLSPAYFTMINTLAICLRSIADKDINKVKSFVNYWLEKIEIEVVEHESYDYAKYILRNTVCNMMVEIGEYGDCVKMCNFTIKEVTSDIKAAQSRDASNVRHKVKIMILAILYKIDCLMFMQHYSIDMLCDMIDKCYALIGRYNMFDDVAIVNAVDTKCKIVDGIKERQNQSESKPRGSDSMLKGPESIAKVKDRRFIIKSSRKHEDVVSSMSNKHRHVMRDVSETSYKRYDTDANHRDIYHTGNTSRTDYKSNTRICRHYVDLAVNREKYTGLYEGPKSVKNINIKGKAKKAMSQRNILLKDLRKDFKREISEIANLTSSLKKEVEIIKQVNPTSGSRILKKADDIIEDDSLSFNDDSSNDQANKDISVKIQEILNSQNEWERQKRLLNDKIERITKNIDIQTPDDTPSNQAAQNNTSAGLHSILKESSSRQITIPKQVSRVKRPSISFEPMPGKVEEGSSRKIADPISRSSRKPTIQADSSSVMTDRSNKSKVYQLQYRGFEAAIDHCFNQFAESHASMSDRQIYDIRQKLRFDGKVYDVLYTVHAASVDKDCGGRLTMQLFDEGSDTTGKPLAEDSSTADELRYILKNLNVLEVLPSHFPVTSLVGMAHVVSFVLHKFVQVGYSFFRLSDVIVASLSFRYRDCHITCSVILCL